METHNPRRWPRALAAVLLVALAVGSLLLLREAVAQALDDREDERELLANAVTTTAEIVSDEPTCTGIPRTVSRRCDVTVEFAVPGDEERMRTTVRGTGRRGEMIPVTYQADRPFRALEGTNVEGRIPSEAYMGVVLSLAGLALAVTGLRPLPHPTGDAELHRTRSVVTVPLVFALGMAPLALITGLWWGMALVVGLPLLLAELQRRHDRLVIGFDGIRQRRCWRGTQRLVPDQRTTIRTGARHQAANAFVLSGPDGSITVVPPAWQDPARVADRLLRVLPAAGATIPPDVAAELWALRGDR